MRRLIGGVCVLTLGAFAVTFAQPPGGPGKKGPKGKGPPGYQMGKVLPPHLLEELDLTREQLDQLAELEKDVKARLGKILTEKQKRRIESLRERGPKGKGYFREKDGRPERQPADDGTTKVGGIQWFATLERGLAEAKRTNRPILFLAAAPHCAGVSGIW